MNPTNTFVALFIGISFFFAACNKSKNDSPVGKMLQAARWQITASEIVKYMDRDTSIDFYGHWRPCEQDDFLEFAARGKGSHNENTNKCPEDNQVDHFTWKLLDNDKKLEITMDGGSQLANGGNISLSEVLEVTNTWLKLRSETIIDSLPATVIETFKNIP